MNDPLVERPKHDFAKPFSDMAKAIEHNVRQGFGGAAVIVAPTGGGEIEILLLDPKGDVAQFYSTIQSRITLLLQKIDEQQRLVGGFGMR